MSLTIYGLAGNVNKAAMVVVHTSAVAFAVATLLFADQIKMGCNRIAQYFQHFKEEQQKRIASSSRRLALRSKHHISGDDSLRGSRTVVGRDTGGQTWHESRSVVSREDSIAPILIHLEPAQSFTRTPRLPGDSVKQDYSTVAEH